jgi:hypothetical protein
MPIRDPIETTGLDTSTVFGVATAEPYGATRRRF